MWAIGVYLNFSTVGSAYGAAGALFIILIWFYYTAMIFLFGATFTKTFAAKHGSQLIKP